MVRLTLRETQWHRCLRPWGELSRGQVGSVARVLKALTTHRRTVTVTITFNGSTIDTKLKLGKSAPPAEASTTAS